MTYICSYCGQIYTSESGPHPYEDCVQDLEGQIVPRQQHLDILNKRLEDVKRLVNEKGQLS